MNADHHVSQAMNRTFARPLNAEANDATCKKVAGVLKQELASTLPPQVKPAIEVRADLDTETLVIRITDGGNNLDETRSVAFADVGLKKPLVPAPKPEPAKK